MLVLTLASGRSQPNHAEVNRRLTRNNAKPLSEIIGDEAELDLEGQFPSRLSYTRLPIGRQAILQEDLLPSTIVCLESPLPMPPQVPRTCSWLRGVTQSLR